MSTLQTMEPEALAVLEDAARKLRLLGWHIERFDRLRDRGFVLACTPPHAPGPAAPPSEPGSSRRGG